MKATCWESTAAREAIHPAWLVPTSPIRLGSTSVLARKALTAPTASAVRRWKWP
jgi:hypothetical protein